jgi:hypothetical protein
VEVFIITLQIQEFKTLCLDFLLNSCDCYHSGIIGAIIRVSLDSHLLNSLVIVLLFPELARKSLRNCYNSGQSGMLNRTLRLM